MSTKNIIALTLYVIGLIIAFVGIIFTYTGLPSGLDTEPLLAVSVILIALAGIISLRD